MRREYFYRVDREGRLFHAGTELTDPRFLDFFFRRLRPNTTGRHPDWPYLAPCGGEWNYVRPEDTPIVFRELLRGGKLRYAGTLTVPFRPAALAVSEGEILYHPAPVGGYGRCGRGVVLALAEALAEHEGRVYLATPAGRYPLRPLEEVDRGE